MSLVVDLYLRLSEDPTGLGAGVQRQETECRDLCTQRGWTVRHVFIDNDISATTGKVRPQFEALLKAGSPAIVVWHIDRLVRVSRDLERVIDLGVNVYAVQSGHLDLSNPAGRAVARTVTAWSTYEGEQKAVRQKAAAAQRAQAGKAWWSSRPFGYEMDGTLRPDEAAALRQAYADVLAGLPLRAIARSLNDAGFTTCREKKWQGNTLRPVLMNHRNAAIRVYSGEEVGAAAWDPVVPQDVFRSAVRILTAPERKVGGGGQRVALLTGVAKCGRCDGPISKAWRGGRSGEPNAYAVYTCRDSHCVSHHRDWVDQWVTEVMVQRLSLPDAGAVFLGGDDHTEELRARVVRLRQKLVELREDYDDDVITRAEFRDSSVKQRERLEQAEVALSATGTDSALASLLGAPDVRAAFDALPVDRQRAAVEAVLESIRLMPRGKGRVGMRPGDVETTFRTARTAT